MRHRVKGRKLSRTSEHRRATLRNLATSLLKHKKIRTTLAKAKELRSFAEPLLKSVPKESEHYVAAERLLNLLSFFEPMDIEKVPFTSILREFIGGCVYEH